MIGDTRFRVALFLAAVVVYAIGSFWGVPSGKAVVGGLVILDGGVPYRDFWAMYAPGQFYAVAALFWLFGRELLVQAIAVAAIRAASSVVFFVLLRRIGAPRYAALCLSAVFVLMFWETGPELTDYPPALLFILLALDQAVQYFSGSGINHLRWAGLWLGLASWFKHDVAAYVALGMASSVILSWLTAPKRSLAGWVLPARATLTLAACAIAASTPLVVWTAWSAGASAWNDLVVFPATVFSKVRGSEFPPLVPAAAPFANWLSDPGNVMLAHPAAEYLSTWIVLNAPLLAFLVGVFVVLVARRRLDHAGLSLLWLFLACMPWFWVAAHVQHNTHPYSLGILSAGVGRHLVAIGQPDNTDTSRSNPDRARRVDLRRRLDGRGRHGRRPGLLRMVGEPNARLTGLPGRQAARPSVRCLPTDRPLLSRSDSRRRARLYRPGSARFDCHQ